MTVVIFLTQTLQAQEIFDLVVAKDGSGTHTSLQEAFEAVPANSQERTFIFIKNGKYKEKVSLETNKANVSLIGQSVDGVIISWDDYSGKVVNGVTIGTSTSQTLEIKSNNFYGENFTVENTAGNVGQAVALRSVGDYLVLNNCKLTGFQDTHYLHSRTARQYYVNCFIEGATDFMFGGAIGYFDKCVINCVKGGQFITAPSDNDYNYGLIYSDCRITANEDVADAAYFLGRPWKDNAKTVWINTTLDSFIKPAGWSVWTNSGDDADNHLTGYFAEYNSMNADGTPADITQRASWGKQLTEAEVADYTLETVFPGWNPQSIAEKPSAPVVALQGDNVITITPQGQVNAIGYVIIRNNKVISFTKTLSYTDDTAETGTGYTYYVQSIGANGNLSLLSNSLDVNGGANDVTPPSIPVGLKAKEIAGFGIQVSWNASTDDEGVKGYNIYRDGTLVGSEEAELFFNDVNLEPGTTYNYTVAAYDLSDNMSEESTGLSYTLKYAWLDDNFSNSLSTDTSLPFFVNGTEVYATINGSCSVVPDRPDYFHQGFAGALRFANEGIFTLPELPNIEKFSFFAATEQADVERTIILQKLNNGVWEDVKSFTVGQGYDASSTCEVTDVRSFEPVQLRLYVPGQVVYVRWFKADRYEASNDAYPDVIPENYTLVEESFNGGIWGTVNDASAVTKEVETTILGVTRKFKVNSAKVMPERGGKGEASKGAIAIPKNYTGGLEMPALPYIGTVTISVVNGTSDTTKPERGLALEKLVDDEWVEIGKLKATPGGADVYTFDVNQPGLLTVRIVNYGSGSTGDVYLQDLKIVTMSTITSIQPGQQENNVKIYPNPFTQYIYVSNSDDFSGYELFNISGQLVSKGKVASSIDFSNISGGFYILKLTGKSGGIVVHKVTKK